MCWKLRIWVGDRQLLCLCSQPGCTFYLHKWLLSHWEHTTWQISCFPDSFFSERQIVSSKTAFFSLKTGMSLQLADPKQHGMCFWDEPAYQFKNLCKIFEFCFISTPPPPPSHFSSLTSKIFAWPCFFWMGLCVMGIASTGKVHTVGITLSRKSHEIRKPLKIGGGGKDSQTCHLGFFIS